jgi:lipid II:glycine glycyltransferase (peptidoglycan interpeptide bridge formation enzyme)
LKQSKKETIFFDFQKAMDEYFKSEFNPDYIMINTSPELNDSRPFMWSGYDVQPMYTYLIDLTNGIDSLWNSLKKELRRDIQKTEADENLKIEVGDFEHYKKIYDLVCRRYKDQERIVNVPKDYLIEIYKNFKDNIRVVPAFYKNEIISGEIQILFKDKMTGWIGVPKTNLEYISPNALIQWKSLDYAIKNGMKYYEEMGANTERLCKYKSKFNPSLKMYFSIKKMGTKTKVIESFYLNLIKPVKNKFSFGGVPE